MEFLGLCDYYTLESKIFISDLKCLLLFFQTNNVSAINYKYSRDHGTRDRNVGLFDKNQYTRLGTGKIV